MKIIKTLKDRRHFGYLLIWIIAGVILMGYYYLVYVPEKEQLFQARYFRVLDRIGKNLNNRFDDFEQQVESYTNTIYVKSITKKNFFKYRLAKGKHAKGKHAKGKHAKGKHAKQNRLPKD